MEEMNLFEKLTDEQKEKFKNCKSKEDLDKLLAEEGIELTPDEIDAISSATYTTKSVVQGVNAALAFAADCRENLKRGGAE